MHILKSFLNQIGLVTLSMKFLRFAKEEKKKMFDKNEHKNISLLIFFSSHCESFYVVFKKIFLRMKEKFFKESIEELESY